MRWIRPALVEDTELVPITVDIIWNGRSCTRQTVRRIGHEILGAVTRLQEPSEGGEENEVIVSQLNSLGTAESHPVSLTLGLRRRRRR